MAMGVHSVGNYAANYSVAAPQPQPLLGGANAYYPQDAYQPAAAQPQDVSGSLHLGTVVGGALAGLMTVVRIARAPGPWALIGAVAVGAALGDWLYNKLTGR